ncbi:MAG: exosome complex RNA-binding protein Csl4 [archaeon]|nr:exosome complex RNA-binding protein Csl4 [archaeon]
MSLKQKLVLPGEFLTVEEEFLPGMNTFEENGNIFSSKIGEVLFDENNRKVSVKEKHVLAKMLDRGSIVFARISLVKESTVVVSIISAENNGEPRIFAFSNASIYVSNASSQYVRDLSELFKIGDIIKAKVKEVTKYSIDLATNEPDLGVVKAFCTKCREPMQLFGSTLKCLNCASNENRKLSQDYYLK